MEEHFKFNYSHNKAKENAIFKGEKYRITILTERLIRLEYNEDGIFFDDLTLRVTNRDFSVPQFKIKEDNKFLEITTKYFKLSYIKNKPFTSSVVAPDANLKVSLLNTDKIWYFKHPEARNYKGTSTSIEESNAKVELYNGLYSTDGFASIDDSSSLILSKNGELLIPENKRIDTYLFMYRRDFGLCLKDYFHLTGKASLIPRYALGIWWNKDEIYSFEDTKKLLSEFSRNKIPFSVLLLGHNWHNQTDLRKTGFTFNKTLFPNPQAFIKFMQERGIRVGLFLDPSEGISREEESYEIIKQNLGYQENATIPFNVFDSQLVNEYFKQIIYPLNKLGIDFYGLDYYSKDLYSLQALNHYHFNDYKSNPKMRGMLLSRNGLVASHRMPIHYSGQTIVSWDTLKFLTFYNSSER